MESHQLELTDGEERWDRAKMKIVTGKKNMKHVPVKFYSFVNCLLAGIYGLFSSLLYLQMCINNIFITRHSPRKKITSLNT